MMLVLCDDRMLEIFDSPRNPPSWIETIDIRNEAYRFCDDNGQRYVGIITEPTGWFRRESFELRPEGEPDVKNVLQLVDEAYALEPNATFRELESLRRHLTTV